MNIDRFIEELAKIHITLNKTQLEQFEKYYQILIEWNKVMNLTGITDKEEVYEKHFFDSVLIASKQNMSEGLLCDVGSGAGFPAIPLKIVFPNLEITIIDSLDKRIQFLNQVIDTLELKQITALHTRAEDYAKTHRNQFDFVTGRAVARLNILLELCVPFLKKNGIMIAMKGSQGEDELTEAKSAIEKLNLKVMFVDKVQLPNEQATRMNIYFQLTKECSKLYPRAFGQIKKKPL